MLRREPSHDISKVSDRELGIASMLLLLTVVLAVILIPALA